MKLGVALNKAEQGETASAPRLAIYQSDTGALQPVSEAGDGCWVNLVHPPLDELGRRFAEWGIPPHFVRHALDVDEIPHTENENGVTLVVLRVPHFQGPHVEIPFVTVPVIVVLTEVLVVTVCRYETDVLRELESGRVRDLSTAKKNQFLLHVLQLSAEDFITHLGEIDQAVDELEDLLQRSLQNRELLALLKYQKSLVYFETALRLNQLLIERLQKSQLFEAFPEDLDLLEDVLTEVRQAITMTEIAGGILTQMMDTFASIISNNLNVVMKFLASVTIVLTLPLLVASYYGMNVSLPLEDEPYAFSLMLVVSIALALVVAVLFWRKGWL